MECVTVLDENMKQTLLKVPAVGDYSVVNVFTQRDLYSSVFCIHTHFVLILWCICS